MTVTPARERLLAEVPDLFARLETSATADRAVAILQPVADTPGPSQIASSTRGRVVAGLVGDAGLLDRGAVYSSDAFGSGCDMLEFGELGATLVAHLDEISYLVAGARSEHGWPLAAYCYHLADGERDAAAIRSWPDGEYGIASEGHLHTSEGTAYYRPASGDGDLLPCDRVVLRSPLRWDPQGGQVTGSLDNAAGAAAAVLAADVLVDLGIPFRLVLTDEEEGPAGASTQTIARGASRILRCLSPSPVTIVTDIHGLSPTELARVDGHRVPWGASLAEYSSATRGAVTPPGLYRGMADLLRSCEGDGVKVRENIGGHVPRSDDVVAMLHSPSIGLLGYPGINRHFDRGLPAANLHDLANLARALAVVAAAVASGIIGSCP
ncbi:MAG: hypothetical protein ACR2HR_16705 [Euzebya sp.]